MMVTSGMGGEQHHWKEIHGGSWHQQHFLVIFWLFHCYIIHLISCTFLSVISKFFKAKDLIK